MFTIKPPGVGDTWDDCDVIAQANLIAFSQLRDIEEAERLSAALPSVL